MDNAQGEEANESLTEREALQNQEINRTEGKNWLTPIAPTTEPHIGAPKIPYFHQG